MSSRDDVPTWPKKRNVCAVIDSIIMVIGPWVMVKKEFKHCTMNDFIRDWVSCISMTIRSWYKRGGEWLPLGDGILKVNFDGASFGNPGPTRYGCIMRDSLGSVILVKGGPLRRSDATQAECTVEGDSNTMIMWAKGKNGGSWWLKHYINEIRDRIKEFKTGIVKIPREDNALADKIAMWGASQLNEFVGDCMPNW